MATAKKAASAKASTRKAPAKKPAATKPAPRTALQAAKPAPKPVAKAPKADKPKKPKLVRDSFTIPKAEYKVIEDSKARAAALGRSVKKSEVLRAGLKALAGLGDAAFIAALGDVPTLKTGRPAKA